jgi:hypothetical protein
MVWTSHVDVKYGDLSSCPWLCYLCLDGHCYPLSYYRCYIYYYYYYYYYYCYAFTRSWLIYLLLYPDLVRWDLRSTLYSRVSCYCVLTADPDFVLEDDE